MLRFMYPWRQSCIFNKSKALCLLNDMGDAFLSLTSFSDHFHTGLILLESFMVKLHQFFPSQALLQAMPFSSIYKPSRREHTHGSVSHYLLLYEGYGKVV